MPNAKGMDEPATVLEEMHSLPQAQTTSVPALPNPQDSSLSPLPQVRSRVTVVCAECKRLKLKCDRRTPCGSCVKRDTVARCIYSNAAAERVDVHSLHNRLSHVETTLTQMQSGIPPSPSVPPYSPASAAAAPTVASALATHPPSTTDAGLQRTRSGHPSSTIGAETRVFASVASGSLNQPPAHKMKGEAPLVENPSPHLASSSSEGVLSVARYIRVIQCDEADWEQISHPEGWLYYFHRRHRVVLDALQQPFKLAFDAEDDKEVHRVSGCSVMICHLEQGAFELEVYYPSTQEGENSSIECLGIPADVADKLKAPEARQLYWKYMADHPSHHPSYILGPLYNAYNEALLHLRWCTLEALIPSSSPTAPFPLKLSQELTMLLLSLPLPSEIKMAGTDFSVSIMLISRILKVKYEYQASYGFWTAPRAKFELTRKQHAADLAPRLIVNNLALLIFMSTICFGTPFRYLRYISELDSLFLRGESWRHHIQRLVKEWTDYNLLAAVVLAATVAFLAIPEIGPIPRTSVLISMLAALGSLMAGLYCVSVYQSHSPEPDAFRDSKELDDAGYCLANLLRHGRVRRNIVAIILSIPLTLLLWSVISFIVCIIAYDFDDSNMMTGTSLGVLFAGVYMFLWVLIMTLQLWFVWGPDPLHRRVTRPFRKAYYALVSRLDKHRDEDYQTNGLESRISSIV